MKYVAALIIICLTASMAASVEASAQARRTGLIRVFAVTQREVADGRMRLVVKRVRDRLARPIGQIGQVCTRLPAADGHARSSCVGTIVMPLGRITYQGVRHSPRFYVLAVTGGTGAYAGVAGSMAARTISTGPRVEWVLVSLV
jgi:hypothetical protein